jgi:hypothetical protein
MIKRHLISTIAIVTLLPAQTIASPNTVAAKDVFLTPTYGILDEGDLKFSVVSYDGEYPPAKDETSPISVWHCGATKNVKIDCAGRGEELEGAIVFIQLKIGKTIHDYTYRRGFGEGFCRDQLTILRRILNRAKNVCIAGSFPLEEGGTESYLFDKIKSKSDEYCYFENFCK